MVITEQLSFTIVQFSPITTHWSNVTEQTLVKSKRLKLAQLFASSYLNLQQQI